MSGPQQPSHPPQPGPYSYPPASYPPARSRGPLDRPADNVPARQRYQLAARAPGAQWWRGLIALAIFAVAFIAAQLLFVMALSVVAALTDNLDWLALESGMSPALLLVTNVSLAVLIPIAMLIERYVFKVPMGQISSVRGRIRWGWLGICALVGVPIWALWIGLGSVGAPVIDEIGAATIAYILIIVLTTPFQAAGEEYGFRGLIPRSFGVLIPHRTTALVVGVLVSSMLFMFAHFATDPWLNVYYFALGLCFSIAAFRTGGLELAILLHVVNNLFSLMITTLTGTMDQAFERSVGAGSPILLLGPVLTLVVLAIAEIIQRRRGRLQTRTSPEPAGPARAIGGATRWGG